MRRVVITGMGVISPVGNNPTTLWENLKAGFCGIDFIRSFDTQDISVKVAAEVKDFDPALFGIDASTARKADLFTLYALAASAQAMKDSNPCVDPERLGVYIGSGIGGIHTFIAECDKFREQGPNRVSPLFIPTMIANIASGNVAIAHNAQGPCLPIVTACATWSTKGLMSIIFTPNGLSVNFLISCIWDVKNALSAFIADRIPSPPALDTAAANAGSVTHAMPP
jgi:3-oxoacyl-[acyl-carrier-protein] synthase II